MLTRSIKKIIDILNYIRGNDTIYKTKEQKKYVVKVFGSVRFIYNKMFADKIKYYEQTNKMLKNAPAQYKREYPFLTLSATEVAHFYKWVMNVAQI